jgi:GntR family transcriptional regulator
VDRAVDRDPVPAGVTARDVELFLGERILRGVYPLGSALPSMREIAAELGISASTVSRALRSLQAQGLLLVVNRRGATVAFSLPDNVVLRTDLAGDARAVVERAQRAGLARDEILALLDRAVAAVLEGPRHVVFTECNLADLQSMGAQVAKALDRPVDLIGLRDLAGRHRSIKDAAVVVPLFHLAEAQSALPGHERIVGVNFVPSGDVVRAVADLPANATLVVVGTDRRSQRRLETLARKYAAATVTSVHLGQGAKVAQALAGADAVVTVHAARLDRSFVAGAQVIEVGFALDERDLAAKVD